ncbi:M1 family metallopeptidase [Foetidibacter luteolus]|uniref:M1 family metallopeptidase n=1 Tax=Foetidibacter luteolus TaxID=2608880 RepID=UPI00129B8158|nr:M1 family metallopeptidase [Foetidibacter luteolus]
MRIISFLFIATVFILTGINAKAQHTAVNEQAWKEQYRASATKVNDLVHTKLDVKFDYNKSRLYGKAWITLQPHFYATDSLALDAKGMDIQQVALVKDGTNMPLQFSYDSMVIHISLDKLYSAGETYTVFIDYTAKPDELRAKGSAAITDSKGLYFINPKGEIKDKPTQVWTQGETEATSVWCPTIDKPNQKSTQEVSMTVPAQYVTLSNGLLVKQEINPDGTRTDYWKMDLPHSPYLFFMGVGDYAIVKDSYKGKEVSYYVEKEYAQVARRIFGLTPEMMQFFSEKLGYEYPWPKYAQIIGRDYVSGAMENTTATLHMEGLQQNDRQLNDENKYEDYISHELFHQWFGDLVTAESWSNLTVNESFADYSEYLWREYKYGKDDADKVNYSAMRAYLFSDSQEKDLVRFYYKDQEDMFDMVSYQKGGRILHMLRNYLGDDAFFKGLNLYLTTNQFGNAEAQQLRLALEQVSGKDLNWFFNQWYFGSGNPFLDISYAYDPPTKTAKVFIKQTQKEGPVFKLPVAVDVYTGATKSRYNVWVTNKLDSFSFSTPTKPDLINVDADKILLAFKDDHKSLDEYVYQYNHAGNYVDRREALEYCLEHFDKEKARLLVLQALDDKYYDIRGIALKNLDHKKTDSTFIDKIEMIARADGYKPNRAIAIDILAGLNNKQYEAFFLESTADSSYTVAAAALDALAKIDANKAIALLPALKKDMRGNLVTAVEKVDLLTKGDEHFDDQFKKLKTAEIADKFDECFNMVTYLANVSNTENFKKGLDEVIRFRDNMAAYSEEFKAEINEALHDLKQKKEMLVSSSKNKAAAKETLRYLEKKLKG